MQALEEPSPFFQRHLEMIKVAALDRPVLDLACGRGRHALRAGQQGIFTIALDHNRDFLSELSARKQLLPISCVECDLETQHGIPIRIGTCGAIFVFRFLSRPLASAIVNCLAPGGLLLYETFTEQQRELPGGPRNPDFLLNRDELPELFSSLQILEYVEEIRPDPPLALASLAARRPL